MSPLNRPSQGLAQSRSSALMAASKNAHLSVRRGFRDCTKGEPSLRTSAPRSCDVTNAAAIAEMRQARSTSTTGFPSRSAGLTEHQTSSSPARTAISAKAQRSGERFFSLQEVAVARYEGGPPERIRAALRSRTWRRLSQQQEVRCR